MHRSVHRRLVFDRRRDRLGTALAAQLPTGASVLDIGCGSGEIGADLAAGGRAVVGVETLARPDCAIEVHEFDGRTLPFGDAEFDWAVIVDVLHHADNPLQLLQEARRVTRSGVVVKDHTAEHSWQRGILGVMDWVGNRQFGVGRDGAYLSRSQWQDLWASADLTPAAMDTSLDLYPWAVKPLFEHGLHFVARLEPV